MEQCSEKAFDKWRYGHYFYFYCTKEQQRDGKVQIGRRTDTTALYC